MNRKNQHILTAISAMADGLIVFLSYVFSTWFWLDVLKEDPNMASLSNFRNGIGAASCLYALITLLLYASGHLYDNHRARSFGKEVTVIASCNLLSIVIVAALLFLFKLQDFSRGVLAIFYIVSTLSMCVKRLLVRKAYQGLYEKGFHQKRILLVGSGSLATQYYRNVQAEKQYGYWVDGVVSIREPEGMACRYLGGLDVLDQHLHNTGIDGVVVALEPEETGHIAEVIQICERNGTKVSVIPFYNSLIPDHPTIESIGDSKLINLRAMPLDNIGLAFLKRAFDIAVSLTLLVVLSPLWIIVAAGIKLTSPGPVLFKQRRVGRNKKPFTMLKFRSMRVNAQQETGWTKDEDPRKTRFGSFIRKTSIDELPQLINVLRGDMSLIGPRPEVPYYVEIFRESIPLYMVKHQVRPGVTGWAQVNGYRGDTSIEGRIRCDIWYIENWSVGLDLRILLRTVLGGFLNQERLAATGHEKDEGGCAQ